MSTLVFDIGGTYTRAALLTKEGIGDVTHMRTPVEPAEAVRQLSSFEGVSKVVGGFAGVVEDGIVLYSTNLPQWDGFRLAVELEDALGAPARVENDAELAALGEAVYGAGKGKSVVAYIGLGTGVGTAHVVDGVVEPHSSEGEARLSIITLSDGTTLEERVGGHSLEKRFGAHPKDLSPQVWIELAPLVAEGVRNAVREWEPDVVVLGGSLMNEENGFQLSRIQEALANDSIVVVKAELGDAAGLWGARALSEQ